MAEVSFHRLLPAGSDVSADAFLGEVADRTVAPAQRPWVVVNFVLSLDGQATFAGRSAPLSDVGDRALFHALRASVDAILAGPSTLGIENYRPADRPIVTVSRSGRLPTEIPLFCDPAGEVILFTDAVRQLDHVPATVTVEPGTDLEHVLGTLHSGHQVRRLLCEGGPRLFGSLLRAGLVDELFLSLGPKLAGGDSGPSLTEGAPAAELIDMSLVTVLEREGTLFLRYLRTDA
ncbi:dihydrofolate reductase family protein [Conexibacter sp. DBS9H8]|uniref:dihydrofolate reductase family protein n=1 Tax=Conexibacter sp. DBS9H8 TaxID=2937801 RepID=UPI00200C51C0|nr:dihydrofolate reductase family protein [Conexibacter sp. DBS9H8]